MSKDFTLYAVQRQLEAMDCKTYLIGIYDEHKGMVNRVYDEMQAIASIGFFRAMNWKGNNIFIKPASGDHALVLVDDVKKDGIDILKRSGFEPACVVETSPENYQVWVKAERPLGPETRKRIARHLCDLASGDPASVDAKHYGRLAGFTNRKEKYRGPDGRFPFVLCRSSSGQIASKLIGLPVEIEKTEDKAPEIRIEKTQSGDPDQEAMAAFQDAWAAWEKRQRGNALDLSSGDLSASSRMARAGFGHDRIAAALRACSPGIEERKKGHVDDYVDRTVRKAFEPQKKKRAHIPL